MNASTELELHGLDLSSEAFWDHFPSKRAGMSLAAPPQISGLKLVHRDASTVPMLSKCSVAVDYLNVFVSCVLAERASGIYAKNGLDH